MRRFLPRVTFSMKKSICTLRKFIRLKPTLTLFFSLFILCSLSAQTEESSNVFPMAIVIIIGVLVLAVVFLAADGFLQTTVGVVPGRGGSDSFFPGLAKWTKPKRPEYVGEEEHFTKLKEGFDILIEGEANADVIDTAPISRFAVQPKNFRGIAPIPKMEVEVGDEVKAGNPLFHDKNTPDIKYVAPVSGEIVEINRGEKRSITEVVILADKEVQFAELPALDTQEQDRGIIINYLQQVGFWPYIKQRPFDLVPETKSTPHNIFISTFDTAPLAADKNLIVSGNEEAFHKGLELLSKLTTGDVHLGLSANGNEPHDAFIHAPACQKHWFKGPHPSGNVGIQIHHIASIGRGEKVWTLEVEDVILLGRILIHGTFDTSRLVALTGAVPNPRYVKTHVGANIGELLGDGVTEDQRIISGDVLSGKAKTNKHFMNIWDNQITVVDEGNEYEMFGWLIPSKPRPSVSRTYPNFLFKGLAFTPDTNMHGERRAFVVTDQYEQLLPMDIYPQHLMKAIIASDFEQMEGLGIYELSEEDIALCEFACTSKMPLQKILREGFDLMIEQG